MVVGFTYVSKHYALALETYFSLGRTRLSTVKMQLGSPKMVLWRMCIDTSFKNLRLYI